MDRNQKFGEPDFIGSRRTHGGGLETALWCGAAVGRDAGGSETVSRHVLPCGQLDGSGSDQRFGTNGSAAERRRGFAQDGVGLSSGARRRAAIEGVLSGVGSACRQW